MIEKKKRLEEIWIQAHSIVQASGSEELKKHFSSISQAYWGIEQNGEIGSETSKAASKGIIELTRIIDDMKVNPFTYSQQNDSKKEE